MLRFLVGAWWAITHPSQALFVTLIAFLMLVLPEVAILILLVGWQLRESERRARASLRVVHGPGFTMRDPDPAERRRRSGLV